MQSNSRSRWLLALAALAGIVLASWLGRARFERWTRAQLAAQYQSQLAQLSDQGAALLVARLAAADDEYLDVVVLALADPRPSVAGTAEHELGARVERWSHWPAQEASPRVAALAELLAQSAERIPTARRGFVQTIAQRLLAWPIDGRLVDSDQLIADCEQLLRLPLPPMNELRLADRTATLEDRLEMTVIEATPPAPGPLPLEGTPELPLRATNSPRIDFPRQPQSLEGASRESPSEPRQFMAPRAIRITVEE